MELQAGEKIVGEPQIGDSVRWNISPGMYGNGDQATQMIVLKPQETGPRYESARRHGPACLLPSARFKAAGVRRARCLPVSGRREQSEVEAAPD